MLVASLRLSADHVSYFSPIWLRDCINCCFQRELMKWGLVPWRLKNKPWWLPRWLILSFSKIFYFGVLSYFWALVPWEFAWQTPKWNFKTRHGIGVAAHWQWWSNDFMVIHGVLFKTAMILWVGDCAMYVFLHVRQKLDLKNCLLVLAFLLVH